MNPGYELGHRYLIVRSLGEGGMANVYLAHDKILDRDVSVKLLRLDMQGDKDTQRRFIREARSATKLNDPHIVRVYDAGETHGMQYMIMEYVHGTDLKQYIKNHFPLPLTEVVDIMQQVLSGVAAAHAAGIIHRDLKPQNILINSQKQVKITDFGIAVATENDTMTQTNTVVGSVRYLSPELARGSVPTPQSDIYALGIILYELLVGQVPFEGETAVSIALKHFNENIPSVRKQRPEIPQSLENVIIRATAKNPADRYASAKAMSKDLSTALDPSRSNEPLLVLHDDADDETKVLKPAEQRELLNASAAPQSGQPASEQDSAKREDSQPDQAPAPKSHLVRWAVAALLLLGAAGTGWYTELRPVKVPDVSGMTTAQAKRTLNKQDLRLGKVTKQASSNVDANHVVTASGQPSRRVNSKVNLVVSSGVKHFTMADYVGNDYNTVADKLGNKGVTVEEDPVYSKSTPAGQIIKQSVSKGSTVDTSQDVVKFKVSKGKRTYQIPDFKNADVSDVQNFANAHNLQLTVKEKVSNKVATDHVISQTPPKGSRLSSGDTLTVTAAKSSGKVKTTDIQINIPFDGNGGKTENRVQVYIEDANHNLTMEYQDITINQETTINVPFHLRNGQRGAYKVIRNGRTIMSATNITG